MQSGAKVSDYCDLFLALTEHRDLASLNDCLMATCLVLFPDNHFWLYDYRELDHHTCKLINSSQLNDDGLPDNQALELLAHGDQAENHNYAHINGYSYYGFSILHSLSGVLITDLPNNNQLEHEVILKLIKVYANQRFFMFSALNDALTGLSNRQAFDQQIHALLIEDKESRRRAGDAQHEDWCFALMDIDHFKQVNDDYGHLFGDEVLLIFAQHMQHTFRDGDLLFRYGGEEFAVALKSTSIESANKVLDRFRQVIADTEFPQLDQVTVSIGFTALEEGLSIPLLIDRADQALYFAKEHGRNQVRCFETLAGSGQVQLNPIHEGDIELF